MKKIFAKSNIHIGFHVGLLLKGLYDIGEILCGILLIFFTPERMSKVITIISAEELREDPNDFIMRHLISFSETFSINMQYTASIYFLSHGLIKIIIIVLLWKQKLWAYPVSCLIFTVFVIIQMLSFLKTYSVTLLILSFIDLVMIILTFLEYRNIKSDTSNSHERLM